MNLLRFDSAQFEAADVAAITGLDVRTVANWTYRGLCDPYRAPQNRKRGRGRPRIYTIRDLFSFVCMRDLGRYGIGVPIGKEICRKAFFDSPEGHGISVITKTSRGDWNVRFLGWDERRREPGSAEPDGGTVRPALTTEERTGILLNKSWIRAEVLRNVEAFLKTQDAQSEEP